MMPPFARLLLVFGLLATGTARSQEAAPACTPSMAMESASRAWVEDPTETALISAAKGRVFRMRNMLIFTANAPNNLIFADAQTGDDCGGERDTLYKLHAIVGQQALIFTQFYEGRATYIVDMDAGTRVAVEAADPLASPDGRYFLFTDTGWLDLGGPLLLFDTQGRLRFASLAEYSIEDAAWEDAVTLKVTLVKGFKAVEVNGELQAVPDTVHPAHITVTDTGIAITLDKTGEILTVPFKAVEKDAKWLP